jgi:membrane-bound metal-dependent hydrolase YbcI (DUF457 family)
MSGRVVEWIAHPKNRGNPWLWMTFGVAFFALAIVTEVFADDLTIRIVGWLWVLPGLRWLIAGVTGRRERAANGNDAGQRC